MQFCHATGTSAKTAGVKNFHNAFAAIYEGRYVAGVAAGIKLNEMIKEAKSLQIRPLSVMLAPSLMQRLFPA